VQNWLKMQQKDIFQTELNNLWITRTGSLKSRGITLKSKISFVSVYLQ
jgi:hypothetical protein